MTSSTRNALEYVRNTNGGATVAIFMDDHEPIGERLLRDLLHPVPLIETNEAGKLVLTEAGRQALGVRE